MNTRLLVLSTLMISICIHLAAFSLFTFSFSDKPSPIKPKFVFLGSILKNQNLADGQKQERARPYNKPPSGPLIEPKGADKGPYNQAGTFKPTLANNLDTPEKTIVKSTFLPEHTDQDNKFEQELKDMGISPHTEPYQPLLFHLK